MHGCIMVIAAFSVAALGIGGVSDTLKGLINHEVDSIAVPAGLDQRCTKALETAGSFGDNTTKDVVFAAKDDGSTLTTYSDHPLAIGVSILMHGCTMVIAAFSVTALGIGGVSDTHKGLINNEVDSIVVAAGLDQRCTKALETAVSFGDNTTKDVVFAAKDGSTLTTYSDHPLFPLFLLATVASILHIVQHCFGVYEVARSKARVISPSTKWMANHRFSTQVLAVGIFCCGLIQLPATRAASVYMGHGAYCGTSPGDIPLTWELFQKGPDHYEKTITCIPGTTNKEYDRPDSQAMWPWQALLRTIDVVLGSMPNLLFIDEFALWGAKSITMEGEYPKLKEFRGGDSAGSFSNIKTLNINGSFPSLEFLLNTFGNPTGFGSTVSLDVCNVNMRDLDSLVHMESVFNGCQSGTITFGRLPKLKEMTNCFYKAKGDNLKVTLPDDLPSYQGCNDYSKVNGLGIVGPPGTVILTKEMYEAGPPSYKAATCILSDAFAGVSEDVVLTADTAPNLRAVSAAAFPASQGVPANRYPNWNISPIIKREEELIEGFTGAITFTGDFKHLVRMEPSAFSGGKAASKIVLGSCPKLVTLSVPGSAYRPAAAAAGLKCTEKVVSGAARGIRTGSHISFVDRKFLGSVELIGPFESYNMAGACGFTLSHGILPQDSNAASKWFPMLGPAGHVPLTQELYAKGAAVYSSQVTCINLLAFDGFDGNVTLGSLPKLTTFEGGAQSDKSGNVNPSGRHTCDDGIHLKHQRAIKGTLTVDGDYPELAMVSGNLGIYYSSTFTSENGDDILFDTIKPWKFQMRSLQKLESVSSHFFYMFKGVAALEGPFARYRGDPKCTTGNDLYSFQELIRADYDLLAGEGKFDNADAKKASYARRKKVHDAFPQCIPIYTPAEVPLEPAVYSKGPDAYENVTCVPKYAFASFAYDVKIGSLLKLKSFGSHGFDKMEGIWDTVRGDSAGNDFLQIDGDFPNLRKFCSYAFGSSYTFGVQMIKFRSLPLLTVVEDFAFFETCGFSLEGEYPKLEAIGRSAFMPGGNHYQQYENPQCAASSTLKLTSLKSLKRIHLMAFNQFTGAFELSGNVPSLEKVDDMAFNFMARNAEIKFFSKDCKGIDIASAYRNYCFQALSLITLPDNVRTQSDANKYIDPTGVETPTYIAGETYRIAPLKLDVDKTVFTQGDEADISYTLTGEKDVMDDWFISASTGVIFGEFDKPGNFTFSVDIVDGGGQQDVLETHDFEVITPPTFTVQKYEHVVPTDLEAEAYAFVESSNDTRSNDLDRQPGDHVQRPYFGVRSVTTGTAGLTYQTVYAGVSVRLPPIDLVEYESGGVRYTQETPRTEAITFTIEGQPRGFFIDPATSEILGSPSLSTDEDGSESNIRTATIYAVNAAQEKAFVEQIRFTVVEQDVSVDTNGPRNRTCANGGVKVDGTKFDGKFTCDCSSTPYVDDNCETAIACNRSQTLDVQTCINFELDYDTSVRATASDAYTEPSKMVGTYYAVGQTYLISPFKLRKNSTTPSVGTFAELQYALDGSLPNGMFLKPKSGEIQVSFSEKDANTIYNVDVDVVDKGGARITIDVLDFPVRYRDVEDPFNKDAFGPNNTACKNGGVPIDNGNEFDNMYECDCSSTGYQGGNCEIAIPRVTSCPKNATLVGGVCKYFELDIDRLSRKEKSGTAYTNPVDIAMQNSYYAVNQSYRVASFEILSTTRPSDGNVSSITYTLAAGAADNFFLSTATGEIFWQFEKKDAEKSFAVTLNAVDRAGAVQEVETMVMHVKYNDVDVPQYGPNRMACNKTNTREVVDTTPFDTIFECDCALGFGGDNCDLPRDGTVPAFGPHGQACSNNSNIIDDIPFNQEFECACHNGYGGDNCEFPLDSSIPAYGPANRTCSINGDIVDVVPFDQEFECKCHSGFGGDNCERNLDAEASAQAKETMILGVAVGASVAVLILVFAIVKYHRDRTAKKDARAALDDARRAYGLSSGKKDKSLKQAGAHHGDHVTNPAFIGITLDDGLGNRDENEENEDTHTPPHSDDELDYSTIPSVPGSSSQGGTSSKFVAPMITLGENTLAAKGLNLLLGVDPKTYMHVRNKIAVMLKEFAKSGTPEDNENIKRLIDGSYKNPDAARDAPRERSLAEVMHSSEVATAGLGLHHVLALRVYTSSSYRSINDPMRQSPPVLPHPFAATLYYISDALSKLREVQGRDPAVRVKTMVFWRGMKNLDITDEFVRTGGTEMACMSTTSSQAVAEEFAESESPLLFKFVSGSFMSHGADISFLSVYPGEKEVLYPPLTYLRPIGLSQQTINGKVYKVAEVEPIFPAK